MNFRVNARRLRPLFCIAKNFSVQVISTMYFSAFYRSHPDFSLLKLAFQVDEFRWVRVCLRNYPIRRIQTGEYVEGEGSF